VHAGWSPVSRDLGYPSAHYRARAPFIGPLDVISDIMPASRHLKAPLRAAVEKRFARNALALTLVCSLVGTSAATAGRLDAFRSAESALRQGDVETFRNAAAELHDHPLWPYLAVEALVRRLDRATADDVVALLDDWRGTAPGERLRRLWLGRLAREERWAEYAELYADNGSETRECLYRRALLATGRTEDAFYGLERRWLTAGSLPAVCDPLFDAWQEAGGLTPVLVWRRILLSLGAGHRGVAAAQRRRLAADDRRWLDWALQLHQDPFQVVAPLQGTHPQRPAILAHGIERLARRDVLAALPAWRQLHEDLPAELADRARVSVGVALADDANPAAIELLAGLASSRDNTTLQHRRLAAALQLEAWQPLADWAAALPPGSEDTGRWHYWRGRALEALARPEGAAAAFREAAAHRDLWGFMAAERAGIAPNLEHQATPADAARVQRLLTSPTIARIRALQRLGRMLDINREWRELTRQMGRENLLAAAVTADRLGLHKQAIHTLANTGYWDDLELRFPVEHLDLAHDAAEANAVTPDWVLAVIRQESAFDPQAASHAGAVGLMQLLPATARDMARGAGEPVPSRMALLDPALSIRLGSRYLAAMRERFDGNELLATAAYNAGPAAVARWLPKQPLAADLWMERIPYLETRAYVRRVLAYRLIYSERLGQPTLDLAKLLEPIGDGPSP
jgi:soluble lytic murein transglycosylase